MNNQQPSGRDKLFSYEWLSYRVPKLLDLWQRQLATEIETQQGLFDAFVITLVRAPTTRCQILEILKSLPTRVMDAFGVFLSKLPANDGRWDWPPGGVPGHRSGQIPTLEVQQGISEFRKLIDEYRKSIGSI